MELADLGFDEAFAKYLEENDLGSVEVGRIAVEHKERYLIKTAKNEYEGEITGNLRFTASSRSDYPAVGDWVAFTPFDDTYAIIHQILPRKTVLERKAVGKFAEKQLIAANIDFAFIVQSLDHDYNINRLERYLAISLAADITPVILMSKSDLITSGELAEMMDPIRQRHPEVRVLSFSNEDKTGFDDIRSIISPGLTFCFMGSSGAGKSTLLNNLANANLMKTRSISNVTHKGKHTTSHRELFVLDEGGIIIDTPGMREIGIIEDVGAAFDEITKISEQCKYADCTHQHEDGCAVLIALDDDRIDHDSYNNYIKMEREALRHQTTVAEKRKRDKEFGKIVKEAIKYRRKNKF